MPGETKTTETQTSQQQTDPWAPTQPYLKNLLSSLGSVGTGVTTDQQNALNNLTSSVSNLPSFTGQTTDLANKLYGQTSDQYSGILNNAYSSLQGQLGGIANQSTDPMSNPGTRQLIDTMSEDTTNAIKSQFGAAGRSMSPAYAKAMARGLSQGEGGILSDLYQQNTANKMNAANSLYGAGSSTATGLSGLNATALGQNLQGLGVASAIPTIASQNAQAQLGAANTAYSQPYQNIATYEGLLTPIAALGSQSSGTQTGTSTQTTPAINNIIGGAIGGVGLLSKLGLLSDRRVKEDVAEIGRLFDGTPVYSFRYIGDPVPRVGLMAQDVERTTPDAVFEVDGIKAVDYGRATERSRRLAETMGA